MKIKKINVIRKCARFKEFYKRYGFADIRILNVGSSNHSLNIDSKCINLDIQNKPNVDVLSDTHYLPFKESSFDIVLLSAVLQYCKNPYKAAFEAFRVLKLNGYVYVDAPFIQAYCHDMPDLFRYTKDGLILIFGKYFSIIECGVSIPGGGALASYCQHLVGNFNNKYLNFALKFIVSIFLLPVSILKYNKRSNVAGAFYLVGQKKEMVNPVKNHDQLYFI